MSQLKTIFPFLVMILVMPTKAPAQSMSVFGGNGKAQECYQNATLASQLGFMARLDEPCNYALEHVSLSRSDRAATLANRGLIHTNGNNFEAALNDFKLALGLRPNSGQIYINRGNAYFLQQQFAMAIDDYSTALDLDVAERHIAHFDRGMAYERLGVPVKAENDYRQALEFMPQWQLAEDILSRLLAKGETESSSP